MVLQTKKNRQYRRKTIIGKGKATLRKQDAPENPYPKKSLESKIFGQFVGWFYYPRGPFPNNSANNDGFVSLERFMKTGQIRSIRERNPEVTDDYIIRILRGSSSEPDFFDIQTRNNEVMIRAKPHIYKKFLNINNA
jgi:hypothetical protein